MTKNDLSGVVTVINDRKHYPAVGLVKTNPEVAAMISKLTLSRQPAMFDGKGNRTLLGTNRPEYEKLAADIAERASDAQNIMQLFPEMELASQILISSIISPKDMSGDDVIYTVPDGPLTPEVTSSLINELRMFLNNDYKFKSLLPKILKDVLFETGSYPVAVIPESSIDDMINGTTSMSMENLSKYIDAEGKVKSYGILGDPMTAKIASGGFGMEAFKDFQYGENYKADLTITNNDNKRIHDTRLNVSVIDNPFILKMPQAARVRTQLKIKETFKQNFVPTKSRVIKNFGVGSVGMEAYDKDKRLTDAHIQGLMYKSKARSLKTVLKVPTRDQASRRTIGKPLIMCLPSESVIPVHVPGDEKQHIGFFVLIDIEGNPVNRKNKSSHYGNLQSSLNSGGNNSLSSYLGNRANSGINGAQNQQNMSMDTAARIYTDIVESDLSERLRNGIHGSGAVLGRNQEVYRIMLARSLANQSTQLLYLPAELMTYFAYKYDENGVGKTLLDDNRILNSLRAVTLFARIQGSIKNSIGRTEVKLKLDERDPNPNRTIETTVHEVTKTRQQYFPMGMNNAHDLMDWVGRAGMEFTFEGHPGIPDMSLEFNEKNTNYAQPDTQLDEDLRKRSIMGLGLSPETVDNAFGPDFATNVVSNNIMHSKRVTQIQDDIVPQMTDHVRKVVANNGTLVDTLRNIIKENLDQLKVTFTDTEELKDAPDEGLIEYLLNWFLESFEIGLPKPSSITLENQMAAFDKYVEGLDKALDAWINANILSENIAGDISASVEDIKGVVRAFFIRKFMADNNIFSELADLTTRNENGKPNIDLMEIQGSHIQGLIHSVVRFMKEIDGMKKAANKDIAGMNPEGLEESTSATPSTSSDDGGDDDLGLDTFGDSDTDLNLGLDETPAPDTTQTPDNPTAAKEKLPELDKQE